jgi:hypothetical protein
MIKADGINYNITKSDNMDECVFLLHDYPVLFVHVVCPLEELRRREKERGDRSIGQGESQLAKLAPQDIYDVTVDTFKEPKEQCADRIIGLLGCPEKFAAFKTLWSQRKKKKKAAQRHSFAKIYEKCGLFRHCWQTAHIFALRNMVISSNTRPAFFFRRCRHS